MKEIHRCTKEADIEVIKNKQDNIEKKIEDIYDAVVGRGDSGLKTDMKIVTEKISTHEERLNRIEKIITGLDLKMAYYAGGIAMIVFLIMILVNILW